MNGILAKEGQEAVVGHGAAKSPAGTGPIVVYLTAINPVTAFEEDTSHIVWMDHIYFSFFFVLVKELLQRFFP